MTSTNDCKVVPSLEDESDKPEFSNIGLVSLLKELKVLFDMPRETFEINGKGELDRIIQKYSAILESSSLDSVHASYFRERWQW